jgi:predicted transposase YbfD/YdcC
MPVSVLSAAMHAQAEHAQFLVTEKNAHYILAVKHNQPARELKADRQLAIEDRKGQGREQ